MNGRDLCGNCGLPIHPGYCESHFYPGFQRPNNKKVEVKGTRKIYKNEEYEYREEKLGNYDGEPFEEDFVDDFYEGD
jgi:hypothetical protein